MFYYYNVYSMCCIAGLVLDRDPTQKAYHGCWWILAPEYKEIREWLMPCTLSTI